VLPVGNGTLLLGAYIGFQELLAARQINRLPRLIAVQAAACAPLAEAHARGQETPQLITPQATLAEGIAIAAPPRGEQILAAVRATQGTFIAVTESEIATAIKAWWRLGFAIEPTAAATLAGLARYLSEGRHDGEVLVSTITGHGLKAIDTISSLGG
jgi:threonine synthase